MDIISQFNHFVSENFNQFLRNYFFHSNYWNKSGTTQNYIDFMTDLDSFSQAVMTNIIRAYFEYIDDVFFHSSYRKQFCTSKGFYYRTILTLFGEVTYKRRYYYDKKHHDRFFFTDLFLNLPKRKYFDPFICAEICNEASILSYAKAGKIVASKVGRRINNPLHISRASARNIVMNFPIPDDTSQEKELKRVRRLYLMLDEKFVGSQFNDGKDHMIKAAVIFESSSLVYRFKKKSTSMDRFQLNGSHTCASIDGHLLKDVIDYIFENYDIDSLEEICCMGDCATWIKNFAKSDWLKFNPKTKVNFAQDAFHFSQALRQLTTNQHLDVYQALLEYVLQNDKESFTIMCNDFRDMFPSREKTILSKRDYILNNWKERQFYQNNPHLKCSMESHISHIFADLFTSRPKAYSKKGLTQLLKLRLLRVNHVNIIEQYLNSLESTSKSSQLSYDYASNFKKNNDYFSNHTLNKITTPIDHYINFTY